MRINTIQQLEGGQAWRDLDLHVDGAGFDALESDRRDPLDHCACPCLLPGSVAQVAGANKNICRTKRLGYDSANERQGSRT